MIKQHSSTPTALITFVLNLLCVTIFIAPDPATSSLADNDKSWKLLWSDEFDGAAGSPPSSSNWVYDIGDRNGGGTNLGWGNQELEYYTSSTDNVRTDGKGNLVIETRQNTDANLNCYYGTCKYTSGRIFTGAKFTFKYGLVEANIKIPKGQGMWPAFWLLGKRYLNDGIWPICGEIDVMENLGKEPMLSHGALHGPGYDPGMIFNSNKVLGDDFHRFAVVWKENEIVWYVDDVEFGRQTNVNSTQWVFNAEFFILLNVAVGGGWPGNPDGSTVFPQQMVVDYVRVYQHNAAPSPPSSPPSNPPAGTDMAGMVTVAMTTQTSWSNGAVYELTFKNGGSKPVCAMTFKIVLASGESISNSWSMEKSPTSNNDQYQLPSWLNLAPGATFMSGLVINGGTALPTVSVVSQSECK